MDYTLRISGDFEKGDCRKCPIGVASDILKGKGVIYSCMYALGGGSKEFCPLEEVKQGEWKPSIWGYPDRTSTCSICGFQYDATDYRTVDFKKNLYPICPNCGADMRGGKE